MSGPPKPSRVTSPSLSAPLAEAQHLFSLCLFPTDLGLPFPVTESSSLLKADGAHLSTHSWSPQGIEGESQLRASVQTRLFE